MGDEGPVGHSAKLRLRSIPNQGMLAASAVWRRTSRHPDSAIPPVSPPLRQYTYVPEAPTSCGSAVHEETLSQSSEIFWGLDQASSIAALRQHSDGRRSAGPRPQQEVTKQKPVVDFSGRPPSQVQDFCGVIEQSHTGPGISLTARQSYPLLWKSFWSEHCVSISVCTTMTRG